MLSEKMRELLASRNMTKEELAELCDLPFETIRNIYYGKTIDPKISTIMKIADAFKLSVNCLMGHPEYTSEEASIIKYYRSCGEHGRSLILLTAKYEATAARAEREASNRHKIPCLIPHGNISDGIVYDMCEVVEVETAISRAYVSIQITSNDLVPVYFKGDILLFENRFPLDGEYAAFYIGNKAYIRKFMEEDGKYILKSVRKMGKNIELSGLDQLEYIGTCCDIIRAQ